MDFVKGIVKKYFRSYNRTLKDGTKKTYKTEQVQVTISKSDNIFDDKEEVCIISNSQANEIAESQDMISALELFNAMLSEENKKLSDSLKETQKDLFEHSSKLEAFTVELDDNKLELDQSNKKLLILKEDCSNLRSQLEENKNTISNLKGQLDDKNFIIDDLNEHIQSLNLKVDSLNEEIDELNTTNVELSTNLNDALSNINEVPIENDLNNNLDVYPSGLNINNNHLLTSTVDEDGEVLVSDVKGSVAYDYNDYIDLQREYIALLRKYEESQENLYNEKVKVIHYKNLLDKFKSFIARLE